MLTAIKTPRTFVLAATGLPTPWKKKLRKRTIAAALARKATGPITKQPAKRFKSAGHYTVPGSQFKRCSTSFEKGSLIST